MTQDTVTISTNELTAIVKQAVAETDTQRYRKLEKDVEDNSRLLTGNGDPEHGLIVKVDRLAHDVAMIKWAMLVMASAALFWVVTQILEAI